MTSHYLSVVAGALARGQKPKLSQAQDAIAKRWRMGALGTPEPAVTTDVIPLLDGWIRRLEREAGPDPAAELRYQSTTISAGSSINSLIRTRNNTAC
jgi:hypothetical protein